MSWHLNGEEATKIDAIYTKIEMAQCETTERFPIFLPFFLCEKRIIAVIDSRNSRH